MRKLLLSVLFVSIIANVVLFVLWQNVLKNENHFAQLQEKYPYLSKRILMEFPQDILINFLPLRKKIKETTRSYGKSFAVYFEYLPTGTSIGINEKDEFIAASLFKLPVVMAYYRHKEQAHNDADPTIKLKKDMLDKRFGDLWQKGEGYEINLKDAVRTTLEKSDNTAARALVPQIAQEDFADVYQGLDIDLKVKDQGALLSAKQYASILKALFYSAVLTKDHSQEILSYMTQTDFHDKLPAGIPDNVSVAHKIGVVELENYEAYLDCGIVYLPRRPYVLCMISQSDEETARIRMKNMSKVVYEYVAGVKK